MSNFGESQNALGRADEEAAAREIEELHERLRWHKLRNMQDRKLLQEEVMLMEKQVGREVVAAAMAESRDAEAARKIRELYVRYRLQEVRDWQDRKLVQEKLMLLEEQVGREVVAAALAGRRRAAL